MPAETVDTYPFTPASRSFFSAGPKKKKSRTKISLPKLKQIICREGKKK